MQTCKRSLIFFSAVTLIFLMSTCNTAAAYDNVTVDYRLLDEPVSIDEMSGYGLAEASAGSNTSAVQNLAGNFDVTFSFKVWLHVSGRTPTELTDGYVMFDTLTTPSVGYQNASFTVNEHVLVSGISYLRLGIFVQFDTGEFLPVAYFFSDKLVEKKINSAEWTLTLHTNLTRSEEDTFAAITWGGQNSVSELTGVEFTEALMQEKGLNLFASGEWVLGVVYPFTAFIGYSVFWGITMLFLGIMVYGRYRRFEPVFVMLLLYGGSGGLGLLIPEIGYRLLYIIVIFVVTILLYRLFR